MIAAPAWCRAVGLAVALTGCSRQMLEPPASRLAVDVAMDWRVEPLLQEPGRWLFSAPSVFLHEGQPVAVMANRAAYIGVQSVMVARRTPSDGWRAEFPKTRASWQVCARPVGDGSIHIAYGDDSTAMRSLRWDGSIATDVESDRCEEDLRCRLISTFGSELRCAPATSGLGGDCEALSATPEMRIHNHAEAVDASGRLRVVLSEHGTDRGGQVRYATCDGGYWRSSVVAQAVASVVSLAVDRGGHAHILYDDNFDDHAELYYATTASGSPTPSGDPRVAPALEACRRVRQRDLGPPGLASYQHGDGFRCAVLERDQTTLREARARLDAECDADDAAACVLAGMTRDWLLARFNRAVLLPDGDTTAWKGYKTGVSIESLSRDPALARALYRRACLLGDAQGCALAAEMTEPYEVDQRAMALKACRLHRADGCALAVAGGLGDAGRDAWSGVLDVLEDGCTGGDAYACNNLGVLVWRRDRKSEAIKAFERACEGALPVGCLNLKRATTSE